MDFIFWLPKSLHYNSVLVVVDYLSKYSHFVPLSHPYMAKEFAASFVKDVIKLHDVPKTIVLDGDKSFMSHFLLDLFRLSSTLLKFYSASHLEIDGQIEVVNCRLERSRAGQGSTLVGDQVWTIRYWRNALTRIHMSTCEKTI